MYYAEHWRYESLRSHDDNYKVNVSGNKCSLGNVNPGVKPVTNPTTRQFMAGILFALMWVR